MTSQPPMISDDLRRQADHFIDLATLQAEVGRDPSERPARRPEPAEDPTTTIEPPAEMPRLPAEPPRDCPLCPRLHDFIAEWRAGNRTGSTRRCRPSCRPRRRWRAAADRRPGARPARRQPHRPSVHRRLCRRPALPHADRVRLRRGNLPGAPRRRARRSIGTAITNAVRCVPPENKPVGAEIDTCRRSSPRPSRSLPRLEAVLSLGAIAHQSVVRALGGALPRSRSGMARKAAGRRHAVLQLSLLALQHQHRGADRGDVRERLRGRLNPDRGRPANSDR